VSVLGIAVLVAVVFGLLALSDLFGDCDDE
jgi:hypothetical protein